MERRLPDGSVPIKERTGDIGLIGPKAKVRSALAALLTAAVLGLGACGGDSGGKETPSAAGTTAAAEQPSASVSDPSSSKAKAQGQQGGGGKTKASSSPEAPQQGNTAKQGAPITLPKGEPEPGATPAQRAAATIASITLSSPVLSSVNAEGAASLPATYTCEGKDVAPPLRWSGIPAGTQELVLFVLNLEPVNEELFFDWAVAGIDPALGAIEEGRLPKGAIVGRNSFGKNGYSVCPPSGKAETIFFALYALAEPIGAKKGFDPAALRKEVLDRSGNVGLLAVSYQR